MWWRDLEDEEYRWEFTEEERTRAAAAPDHWPTPGEVFFEIGIVLAGTVGFAAVMALLLTLLGIPRP